MINYFGYTDDDGSFNFLFVCIFILLLIFTPICIEMSEQNKKEEAKTYIAYVELPTGEIKTYEVDNYEVYSSGKYLFTLTDGRKIEGLSNNVIIEEDEQGKEEVK